MQSTTDFVIFFADPAKFRNPWREFRMYSHSKNFRRRRENCGLPRNFGNSGDSSWTVYIFPSNKFRRRRESCGIPRNSGNSGDISEGIYIFPSSNFRRRRENCGIPRNFGNSGDSSWSVTGGLGGLPPRNKTFRNLRNFAKFRIFRGGGGNFERMRFRYLEKILRNLRNFVKFRIFRGGGGNFEGESFKYLEKILRNLRNFAKFRIFRGGGGNFLNCLYFPFQ